MTTALIGETFTAIVAAPFGAIGIRTEAGQLHELTYLPPQYQTKAPRDALNKDIVRQVSAYLANPDYSFTVSLPEVGTAHQRKVWAVIQGIPRGEVLTYAQVAREIGSAPRAVGQACGANWYPVLIPCHRVVAAGGIGGFARHDGGFHLGVKRWLLAHEGVSGF